MVKKNVQSFKLKGLDEKIEDQLKFVSDLEKEEEKAVESENVLTLLLMKMNLKLFY